MEAGAGIGAVSCHANRLLSDPSKHVAIEMNRRVLPVLSRNRDRNGARFEILWGAVGPGTELPAYEAWSPGAPYNPATNPDVPKVRISELLRQRGWDRINLMLDVEGAELDLLDQDPGLFAHVERLVVEWHPYQREPSESGRFYRRLAEMGLEAHVVYGAVMGLRRAPRQPRARAAPIPKKPA